MKSIHWDGWELEPLGDQAAILRRYEPLASQNAVQSIDSVSNECSWVHSVYRYLLSKPFEIPIEVAPAFDSITLYYPSFIYWHDLESCVPIHLKNYHEVVYDDGKCLEIPIRYDIDGQWDLADIAAQKSLTIQKVIELHSNATYRVQMIGFSPGFPYLSGLPKELATPRKATPRLRVPAGSVAIGGNQTGIYPRESPGGWNIIGTTDVVLFDPLAQPPSLLAPGDQVRFIPTYQECHELWLEKGRRR